MKSRQSRTSRGGTLFISIALSAVCLYGAGPSWGWTNDPTVNTEAFTPQPATPTPPQLVEDGAGGVIVTTGSDTGAPETTGIYTRRLNANGAGNDAWAAGGVLQQMQAPVELHQTVSDGAGGSIVVWVAVDANGSGDIYAQRYDALGRAQWGAGGIAVCTAVEDQSDPQIASDGAGGAVIVWNDLRGGLNYDIYAQRIDATGKPLWQADGVAVMQGTFDKLFPQLTGDGDGAMFVVWQDYRKMAQTPDAADIGADLYAQAIGLDGTLLWANEVAVSAAVNDQIDPVLTDDGAGGFLVAWEDYRDDIAAAGLANVYAQHLDAGGNTVAGSWVADGIPVALLPGADQQYAQIATDGAGGAFVVWQDDGASGRINYRAYAQHLGSDGTAAVPEGSAVTASGTGYTPKVLSDGNGGAFVLWKDYRNDPDTPSNDLYAQRIDAALLPAWADDLAVTTAPGDQYEPQLISDGAGGAIAGWLDDRNGVSEIYLQRIDAGGTLSTYTTPSYNVVFKSCWPGSLVGTAIQTVTEGTAATAVEAVALPHYHFVNWTDASGQTAGTSAVLLVDAVAKSETYTANFAIDTYTVSFSAGPGGTLVGQDVQTVPWDGSTTAMTASPLPGYHFVNWTDAGGNVIGTSPSLTFNNVAADSTAKANFAIDTYTVRFSAGSGGYLVGQDVQTVAYDTATTAMTAVPLAGYRFVNWTDAGGNEIGTSPSLTISHVTADQTAKANFVQDAIVPGAPVITAVSAANGEAVVTFTPPASNGSSPITGYTVTALPGNISVTGSKSPITVPGLKNGTAYTFTVTATSATGTGPASAPSAAITPYPVGDVNGDGLVDISDAVLALRLSLNLAPTTAAILARADVAPLVENKPSLDGKINVGDAVVILRKIVGLTSW